MPRRPKARDGLTAGERVRLYEAEQKAKAAQLGGEAAQIKADGSAPDVQPKMTEAPQRTKRQLPLPQHAVVSVDLSVKTGEINPMHGTVNGPVSYGADLSELYREASIPAVLIDGCERGCAIDDIFGSWEADPTSDGSYDFTVLDRSVAKARAVGARVFITLGFATDILSREESQIPDISTDTLNRVCLKIVKRYYDGGLGGVDGFIVSDICPRERLREVYSRISESVKLCGEEIRVGISLTRPLENDGKELLKYCKRNHVPMDIITAKCFGEDVEEAAETVEGLSAYLKNLGLDETRILPVICYAPLSDTGVSSIPSLFSQACPPEARKRFFDKRRQTEGAAYLGAMALRLGDIDGVCGAFAYDMRPYSTPWCPLTDAFGNKEKPFYVFRELARLSRARASALAISEQTPGMRHTGIYAKAAVGDSEAYCLLFSFGGCSVVDLRLDGIPDNLYSAEVYMLDGVKNMTLADTVPLSGMKKRLLLNVSSFGAIMVRLY